MSLLAWSWFLTINGAGYAWIAGRWPRVGWPIGLFSQSFWIVYALQTHQYGFLASATLFSIVYGNNWCVAVKESRCRKDRT